MSRGRGGRGASAGSLILRASIGITIKFGLWAAVNGRAGSAEEGTAIAKAQCRMSFRQIGA
jgi:hypothetical protein